MASQTVPPFHLAVEARQRCSGGSRGEVAHSELLARARQAAIATEGAVMPASAALDADPVHEAREEAIQALCRYQRVLGGHPAAFNVHTIITLVKAQRPDETVRAMDDARLAKARAT